MGVSSAHASPTIVDSRKHSRRTTTTLDLPVRNPLEIDNELPEIYRLCYVAHHIVATIKLACIENVAALKSTSQNFVLLTLDPDNLPPAHTACRATRPIE
jgi:hypothetical protein